MSLAKSIDNSQEIKIELVNKKKNHARIQTRSVNSTGCTIDLSDNIIRIHSETQAQILSPILCS